MKKYPLIFIMLILAVVSPAFSQKQISKQQLEKGKTLAAACITCHATTEAVLADPLQRIRKIRPAGYIYALMKNPMQFADENKTAKKVFAKRGLQMPAFANLSKAEINAILDYFDSLPYNANNYKDRIKN
ncbi:MAG: c-type cytochrome [Ferruginibacter sp.]